jgi:hypothetical protein
LRAQVVERDARDEEERAIAARHLYAAVRGGVAARLPLAEQAVAALLRAGRAAALASGSYGEAQALLQAGCDLCREACDTECVGDAAPSTPAAAAVAHSRRSWHCAPACAQLKLLQSQCAAFVAFNGGGAPQAGDGGACVAAIFGLCFLGIPPPAQLLTARRRGPRLACFGPPAIQPPPMPIALLTFALPLLRHLASSAELLAGVAPDARARALRFVAAAAKLFWGTPEEAVATAASAQSLADLSALRVSVAAQRKARGGSIAPRLSDFGRFGD